jgi:hypothetical protein
LPRKNSDARPCAVSSGDGRRLPGRPRQAALRRHQGTCWTSRRDTRLRFLRAAPLEDDILCTQAFQHHPDTVLGVLKCQQSHISSRKPNVSTWRNQTNVTFNRTNPDCCSGTGHFAVRTCLELVTPGTIQSGSDARGTPQRYDVRIISFRSQPEPSQAALKLRGCAADPAPARPQDTQFPACREHLRRPE